MSHAAHHNQKSIITVRKERRCATGTVFYLFVPAERLKSRDCVLAIVAKITRFFAGM
jgi:hypothetical protein